MDLQIKLLSSPDAGNHVIVIAGGFFDLGGLELVFARLATTTKRFNDCKVVIDFQDTTCDLSASEINRFANGTAPELRLSASKIALVSIAETEQYDQVFMLSAFLANQGFPVSVFDDAKTAVRWLTAKA
jgi:hypothetical protein